MSSIITFIIVLSVLVLVHEAGHFFAARKAGLWVEEFGFGLPPRVWGKKVGETIYSINLLPFGGFVRIHGENVEEGITEPKRAFLNAKKKTRAAIVLAGVVMNFLLAILAFTIVYSFTGVPRDTGNVKAVQVMEGSPAAEAGLRDGNIITQVNGVEVNQNEDFMDLMGQNLGEEVFIAYKDTDSDQIKTTKLTPRKNPPEGQGAIGVVISDQEIYYPPVWQRPFYGAYYGIKQALLWGAEVINGFAAMISKLIQGSVPQEVAGPVGIYALTSEAASFGILALIEFVGILSVNLAVLNVIPFPALDGGRLLFIVIESLFGKKIVPKVEAIIHTAGMIILLLLILAITATDIKRLIQAGGISGYLDTIIPE